MSLNPIRVAERKSVPGAFARLSHFAASSIEGIDPFAIKRWSRVHPYRLVYTVAARLIEREAKCNYTSYALPDVALPSSNASSNFPSFIASERENTRLTPAQMELLLYHARLASNRQVGAIVEVGSYRGVTTRALAEFTKARVYAVDPFALYGGTKEDFLWFRVNTSAYTNIFHIKKTSGEAVKELASVSVSFVFIDATPGYVNVKHDASRYGDLLVNGGLLAINNVDNENFPGSRKAAWELTTESYDVITHAHDIVVLARRADDVKRYNSGLPR
jgi:predicted O-methyltransferase YrrM